MGGGGEGPKDSLGSTPRAPETIPKALSFEEQLTGLTRLTRQGDQSRWRKAQGQGNILFIFLNLKSEKACFSLVINVMTVFTLCKTKISMYIKL